MTYRAVSLANDQDWKELILSCASSFNHLTVLDSCGYQNDRYSRYDWLVAGNAMREGSGSAFSSLQDLQQRFPGWWMFRLNYELKDQFELLHSKNPSKLEWPDARLFLAEWVVTSSANSITLHLHPDSDLDRDTWEELFKDPAKPFDHPPIELNARLSREGYIERAEKLMSHIQRGDIYEVNFCQEFYAEDIDMHPVQVYQKLLKRASPPMSALWRAGHEWVLSMSPERFIQKKGDQIISQPIKGTAKRSTDPEEDKDIARALRNNIKEQAENVMIVDLVRNDLSRIAKRSSVHVPELFKVYPFPTVHQMISTVQAVVRDDLDLWDILKATFPMGSMTGAPKVRAMQLIEENEVSKRGIYSGALGYLDPNGDFDFNVVIRTVVFDAGENYLSVSVGSALTAAAHPEMEWLECDLKLAAIREVLLQKD